MLKKILAATDLITDTDAPVLTAIRLAEQHHSTLHILHVLESASVENRHLIKHFKTGEDILTTPEYEETVRNEIHKTYADMLDSHVDYDIQVITGFPWEEILKQAKDIRTDLIVVGPHSKRAEEKGVVRIVGKIGSTVEGVITRESCPVMIVNSPISEEKLKFRRVVVGIDFSNSCECGLCFAIKLAQRYESELFTFHMLPIPPFPKYSPEDYQADMALSQKRLEEFSHAFLDGTEHEYLIRGGALPHLEILKCAEEKNADLIVMGSHTKEHSGKWYAGSVVERVSFRAKCPVIVITDPDVLLSWENGMTEKVREKKEANRLIHVFGKK